MRTHLKKLLSYFFLFIFLFPLAEKEVHGFECDTDIHCAASEKHFHNLEHHCAICDFTITDSNTPTKTDYQLINLVHPFVFQLFSECIHSHHVFQLLPSRGPPVI